MTGQLVYKRSTGSNIAVRSQSQPWLTKNCASLQRPCKGLIVGTQAHCDHAVQCLAPTLLKSELPTYLTKQLLLKAALEPAPSPRREPA